MHSGGHILSMILISKLLLLKYLFFKSLDLESEVSYVTVDLSGADVRFTFWQTIFLGFGM